MPEARKKRRINILLWGILGGCVLILGGLEIAQRRSAKAWLDFKARWEAQGESFEFGPYLPAPVPPDDNLAHHPVFEGFMNEDHPLRVIEHSELLGDLPPVAQDLCQHIALTPEKLAELADGLAPLQTQLQSIATALAERPQCLFPVDYELGIEMRTDHTYALLSLAVLFEARCRHALETNDHAEAFESLLATRRLGHVAGSDRYLSALLVEQAIHRVALGQLWLGLNKHAFDPEQLAQLANEFDGAEQLPERLMTTVRLERAVALNFIDQSQGGKTKWGHALEFYDRVLDSYPKFLRPILFDRSRLAICEDPLETLLRPGGTARLRPRRADAIELDTRIAKRWKSGVRYLFEGLAATFTPSWQSSIDHTLDTEAELTNGRLAIALERHCLSHGSYPTTLAALVPEFLPALPTDRINERPIEYRLNPDGTPLIYQWGCNGNDDGGAPHKAEEHGDVVWQYNPAAPLSKEEWLQRD